MLNLSIRTQWAIGSLLVLLIVATRGHHFASLQTLPGASWAVFFLAGIYLRSRWAAVGLLMLTWLLDYTGYIWGGSSGYCLTPAYLFLVPAYGSLWYAGRWYARRHCFAWRTLLPLAGAMLAGALVCELLSSGGFYFFSGRFAETSWTEFGSRVWRYFPMYLESMMLYVDIATVVHLLFGLAHTSYIRRNGLRV